MESLGLDLRIIIANALSFLLIFYVLKKFLFTKIIDFLEDLERKDAERIQLSEKIRQQAEEAEEKTKKIIRETQEKAEKLFQERLSQAETKVEEKREKFRKEIKYDREKAEQSLRAEKEKMVKEIKEEIIQRITREVKIKLLSLSEKNQEEILNQSLKHLI